jgi:5-methylthioadenosine/S-adenosylhomocysteine deaminase
MNLIRAAYLIADPSLLEASVLRDAALVINEDVVVAVGPWHELQETYRGLEPLELPYHSLVIPGLVNAHHHGRGLATTHVGMADKPLELWLPSFILYPPLDPYLDTLYTTTRMLQSGVTTSLLSHSDSGPIVSYRHRAYRSLEAFRDAGVRVAFALGHYDQNFLTHRTDEDFFSGLPTSLARQARQYFDPKTLYIKTEDYFDFFEELYRDLEANPKIRLLLSPCGFHWASNSLQQRMAQAAEHYQTQVHLHALETRFQRAYAEHTFGKSTARVLSENGLLGAHVSLAHGIHITVEDIDLIAQTKTKIVTNPSSNLRLGSGLLPLHSLLKHGISIALGMDSMTLFADDDMLGEICLLQALHRQPSGERLSPYEALELTTVQGARATGFSHIGKLLPNYQADITVIDLQRFSTPYLDPEVDIIGLALAGGKATDVQTVFVAGEMLVAGGQLCNFRASQLSALIHDALKMTNELSSRTEKLAFLQDLEAYLINAYAPFKNYPESF